MVVVTVVPYAAARPLHQDISKFASIVAATQTSVTVGPKYVMFDNYGGANNVREAFTLALYVAYMLNATVVLPANTHVHLDSIFNISGPNNAIDVALRTRFTGTPVTRAPLTVREETLPNDVVEKLEVDVKREECTVSRGVKLPRSLLLEKYTRQIPVDDQLLDGGNRAWTTLAGNAADNVVAKIAQTDPDSLLVACTTLWFDDYWGYVSHTASFETHEQQQQFDIILEAAQTWVDPLQNLFQLIKPHLPPVNFVTLHYRTWDRTPLPLLNCSHYGFAEAPLSWYPCTHASDPVTGFVTFEETIMHLKKIPNRVPIYAAVSDIDDERFAIFKKTLENARYTVLTFQDIASKAKEANKEAYEAAFNAVLKYDAPEFQLTASDVNSLLDQMICAEGAVFLPHAGSSWSELVVYKRYWKTMPFSHDDRALFAQWAETFPREGFAGMYYGDTEGSMVIPNFITRCPSGTQPSGWHCTCEDPLRPLCVGSQCSHRNSQKTFRMLASFHSSCTDCHCQAKRPKRYGGIGNGNGVGNGGHSLMQ